MGKGRGGRRGSGGTPGMTTGGSGTLGINGGEIGMLGNGLGKKNLSLSFTPAAGNCLPSTLSIIKLLLQVRLSIAKLAQNLNTMFAAASF